MKSLIVGLLLGAAAAAHVSPGLAADLIVDQPAAVGVVDASRHWDGPFVGVAGGWIAGDYWQPSGNVYTDEFSGWLVGVTAGANITLTDGIVAGLVGDLSWVDAGFVVGTASFDVDWIGSLRGRLGYDAGAFLPYLTAGLAVAGATVDSAYGAISHTHVGWTAGAGVEYVVTDDLSLDLLYRYSEYGAQTYDFPGPPIPFGAAFRTHQVTVGLNWQF